MFDVQTPTVIDTDSAINRRSLIKAASAATLLAGAGVSYNASAQELFTMSGEPTGLMDNVIAGKWNLVMMWSLTCGICVRESPVMSQLYDDEKDGNITVLGVSIDGQQSMPEVEQWMKRHDMRFPNFVGELITVASNFKALTKEDFRGTPTFILFNPEGKLAAVQPGPLKPEALRRFVAKQA